MYYAIFNMIIIVVVNARICPNLFECVTGKAGIYVTMCLIDHRMAPAA